LELVAEYFAKWVPCPVLHLQPEDWSLSTLPTSHGTEPHIFAKSREQIRLLHTNNLINPSTCKQEIRHHPRLFLSDNDDLVSCPISPARLRLYNPVTSSPPLRGNSCALFRTPEFRLVSKIYYYRRRAPFPISLHTPQVEDLVTAQKSASGDHNFSVCANKQSQSTSLQEGPTTHLLLQGKPAGTSTLFAIMAVSYFEVLH
jgi:hypothetical protein